MLMYKDLPGLQVVVHSIRSFPLLRNLSTLRQQHFKDANHLRRAYPQLRHGHEKAHACRQLALRLGDQGAEQAMATKDMADLDYDAADQRPQNLHCVNWRWIFIV